jgi:ClpP class serine protease
MRQVEMMKEGFFTAVRLGRGDKLTAGDNVTFSGQIWSGMDALKIGIIDEFGTETDGAKKAAELAKVAHYKVLDLAVPAGVNLNSGVFFFQSPDGMQMPYPNEAGIYMLYIPPLPVKQ